MCVSVSFQHPPEKLAIQDCITKILIDDLPISESRARSIARKTLKIVGDLFLVVANAAFIEDSYHAVNSPYFGSVVAIADTLSYLGLSIWLLHRLVDHYLEELSKEERFLFQKEKIHVCGQIAILGSAFAIGGFLNLPLAIRYASLNGEWFPPLMMAISAMTTDTILPLSSLVELQERLFCKKRISAITRDVDEFRIQFISLLEEHRDYLGNSLKEMKEFTDEMRSITSHDKLLGYLKRYQGLPKKKSNMVHVIAIGKTSLFFLVNNLVLGLLAFEGIVRMTGSLGAGVTACALSLIANTYLQTKSILLMSRRICQKIGNLFSCIFQTDLSERLSPTLSLSLKLSTLALSILSYPTTVQLIPEMLKFNASFELFITITFCTGMTYLLLRSLLDLTHQIVSYRIRHFGQKEAIDLLKLQTKLTRIIRLLQRGSMSSVLFFFKNEARTLSDLLPNFEKITGKLDRLIEENFEDREVFLTIDDGPLLKPNYGSLQNT